MRGGFPKNKIVVPYSRIEYNYFIVKKLLKLNLAFAINTFLVKVR